MLTLWRGGAIIEDFLNYPTLFFQSSCCGLLFIPAHSSGPGFEGVGEGVLHCAFLGCPPRGGGSRAQSEPCPQTRLSTSHQCRENAGLQLTGFSTSILVRGAEPEACLPPPNPQFGPFSEMVLQPE